MGARNFSELGGVKNHHNARGAYSAKYAPDKSDVAVHHKLVKRVAKKAATVLALIPSPSDVLGLLGHNTQKVAFRDHEGLGEVLNLFGMRSIGTKIGGVVSACQGSKCPGALLKVTFVLVVSRGQARDVCGLSQG